MSNIQKVMNEEVRRLARKEIKAAIAPILAINAALKKKVAEQEKRIRAIEAQGPVKAAAGNAAAEGKNAASAAKEKAVRLTPERIKKIRKNLHVSQAQLAQILGVNTQSVNFWENGKTTPRMNVKHKLAEIRDMGKRELVKLFADKAIVAKKTRKDNKTKDGKAAKKVKVAKAVKEAKVSSEPVKKA